MADLATFNPAAVKNDSPRQVMDWEYDERRFEKEAFDMQVSLPNQAPKLPFDIGLSLPTEMVKSGMTDIFSATLDLFKENVINSGGYAIGEKKQTELKFGEGDKAKIYEARWQVDQQAKVGQKVEQVTEMRQAQDLARLEVQGMSDELLAEKGNYQRNYSKVRTIYNMMSVFFKRVAEIMQAKKQQTASAFEATATRANNKFNLNMKEGNNLVGTSITSAG